MVIQAAERYQCADDLSVITTYFNPVGYTNKRRNYERFRDAVVAGGTPLITVECAFGTDPFSLTPGPGVIQLRARDLMWQKERLLNMAIDRLSPACRKIAWVDCDIVFENAAWMVETSRRLDHLPVLQPFDVAIRLPPGVAAYSGEGDTWRGFALAHTDDPDAAFSGDYRRHGETGFGWAARRDVLDGSGLYDACIIGGGDHVMAHVMCGDWTSRCIDSIIGLRTPYLSHLQRWAEPFHARVRGELGHVPGAALHLWHGELCNRRYANRHKEQKAFGFDPTTDLRLGEGGCWEWASAKPEMHRWAAGYFSERQEDPCLEGAG